QSQIAARKASGRELSIFSGSAEQWPLFIASYEHSTAVCGYSDDENLMRLQKALKGAALEAVSSLLLLPSGLKEAIATLKMRFGRPDVIVDGLIEKVRRMPSPRADKLETLTAFGFAVRNMCATIRAAGLPEYTCNVVLMKELVSKLPPTTCIEWARHQQRLPGVTLTEFGQWIGSSSTFMDHSLMEELGLSGTSRPLCLKWTGDTTREETASVQLVVQISGAYKGAPVHELAKVHTVGNLALPSQSIDVPQLEAAYPHLKGLPLASYTNAIPRLLLGVDNCRLGKSLKCTEGRMNEPIASKTR
uniref:Uncharacterized protein n=1 Tax=Anopheles epiroticus TaxID=199890 RepID=A0A182PX70_9DIPT